MDISVLTLFTIHPLHSKRTYLAKDVKLFFCQQQKMLNPFHCMAAPLITMHFVYHSNDWIYPLNEIARIANAVHITF